MALAAMPFIMPDGTRLSSVLTNDDKRSSKTHRSKKQQQKSGHKLSRQQKLDHMMQARNDEEAEDLAQASHLGARPRLRCVSWLASFRIHMQLSHTQALFHG